MKELAIIIPVYNEEEIIEKVLVDWSKIISIKKFDIIIINDGSKDNTKKIILKLKQKIKNLILINKINEGHGKALIMGYRYAQKKKYRFIFQTDSDDQFYSNDFKKFWRKKDSKKFDIILGDRFKRNDPFLRVFLSRFILSKLLRFYFGKSTVDANIPYRLITNKFIKDFLELRPEKYIAPNIIMTLYAKNIWGIKVKHKKRDFGEVKWSLKKLVKFGLVLLKDLKTYYIFDKKKNNEKN
ncbi:glycosyltransferase family 2 protein [Candidatus Pelagibacter sp.]|nr:glycosyltransferase family 2 protein [Candidatus Pelagibacter bacterium]MDB3970741.1 glycosyltransferase family 2 protein [Candidatus Pelagibacter sp.]